MAVRLWSGVGVSLTSATATALAITGITKANPAVVTVTGSAPANGSIVYLVVQGMNQVNERAFRVSASSGSTFALEGVDSTSFDTFTSGTAQVNTMGTSLSSARNVSASGGEADEIDISTIHDLQRKTIPGPTSASQFDFECFWDPTDAGLVAFKAASDGRLKRVIRLTWPDGASVMFGGYVSAPMVPTGSGQDVVTTNVRVTVAGTFTVYTS